MDIAKFTSRLSNVVFISLLLSASNLYAEKIIPAEQQAAGFRLSSDVSINKPAVSYRRNIQMLSETGDMPSLNIYGDGRVHVHYPVYMKNAGDYEMQLDDAELTALLRSLSSDGLMELDEEKIKSRKTAMKRSLRAKGKFYKISDDVISVIGFQLDEYQKNSSSQKIKDFSKQVKWKNLEHDVKLFKSDDKVVKANNAVSNLKALMKDSRLLRKERR